MSTRKEFGFTCYKNEVLDVFLNWKKIIKTLNGDEYKSYNDDKHKTYPFMHLCQDEDIV